VAAWRRLSELKERSGELNRGWRFQRGIKKVRRILASRILGGTIVEKSLHG
jgi:hypothetical protein